MQHNSELPHLSTYSFLIMNSQLIHTISEYFKTKPVQKAWVFGSFARGEEGPDSDIDILVTLDKEAHVGLIKFSGMRCELEERLQRSVDLVVEGALMPYAVDSVNRDKILVYERVS